jgi:hypothetical protein
VPSQKIARFPFDLLLLISGLGRSAERLCGTGAVLRFSRAARQIGNCSLGHHFRSVGEP